MPSNAIYPTFFATTNGFHAVVIRAIIGLTIPNGKIQLAYIEPGEPSIC